MSAIPSDPLPFLRPRLAPLTHWQGYLAEMEENRHYSNFGPLNTRLEGRILAECFQGRGAVTTVGNATLGLILALSLLRRPGGRLVVMPSFTFPALPLAAQWAGLEPFFVDVDPETWTLCPDMVEQVVGELGDSVAAVTPYAALGTALPLDPYARLHRQGIPVVVDAASGFGVSDQGVCHGQDFPGALVYSFHATKPFAVGEGGLIYSTDAGFIARLRQAANFGLAPGQGSVHPGLNAKLPEVAAAIGLATLDLFEAKVESRQQVHKEYLNQLRERGFQEQGWRLQVTQGRIPHAFFSILCPARRKGSRCTAWAARHGVTLRNYHAPACHQQPQFHNAPREVLPVSENLASRVVSLPFWEGMTPAEVARVVEVLATWVESGE